MEKILITGASGFFGSNLVHRLVQENYDVHILTRESSNLWRLRDVYEQINDWKCELTNATKLKEIIHHIQPQHIIHSATYGGRPFENEEQAIVQTNLMGIMNLLSACQDIDFETFINTGSSSEYGLKETAMKESDACFPSSVYGISKLSSTLYCDYCAKQWNKNIGTIRLFSPFGDFEDQGRLFPDLILNAIHNEPIYLSNPNAVRDFIYVQKAVDLYVEMIKEKKSIQGEIYNCGSGTQTSVLEVALQIKDITRSTSEILIHPNPRKEQLVSTWVADVSKTTAHFNWKPTTSLHDELIQACTWFEQHKDLYKGEKM